MIFLSLPPKLLSVNCILKSAAGATVISHNKNFTLFGWYQNISRYTGKSLSEALILESTNPQYDKRLFIDLPVQYMLCTQIVFCFDIQNNL